MSLAHPTLILAFLGLAVCPRAESEADTNRLAGDAWVTNAVMYPRNISTNSIRQIGFENLRAEVVAERLSIFWKPDPLETNATVTLAASVDELGHWPARDWRYYPMVLSGATWETRVPVIEMNVPIVYFIRESARAATNISPMRICRPREAGLEVPTRPFWPFLEGFEQGLESWSVVGRTLENRPLTTDPIAINGYSSLRVELPAGRHSVTVGTTRVRGWHIQEEGATGVRLWLRTKSGTGRARFTLHANAFTPSEVIATSSIEARLNDEWQKVDLRADTFPGISLGKVDWFTIEFIGRGPIDFLIDDVQLLGPWRMDLE